MPQGDTSQNDTQSRDSILKFLFLVAVAALGLTFIGSVTAVIASMFTRATPSEALSVIVIFMLVAPAVTYVFKKIVGVFENKELISEETARLLKLNQSS